MFLYPALALAGVSVERLQLLQIIPVFIHHGIVIDHCRVGTQMRIKRQGLTIMTWQTVGTNGIQFWIIVSDAPNELVNLLVDQQSTELIVNQL